jgi:SAM-dependent methyltransferase
MPSHPDGDVGRDRWEVLGRDDPLWAVLSVPGTEHGGWDPGEFFRLGAEDVERVHVQAAAIGLAPGRRRALDFGCGVGRLSLALAERYDRVTGVDVAESMLEGGRRWAVAAGAANVDFVRNDGPVLPFATGTFDLVLSLIVLQHLPPALARRCVAELIRVAAPDGVVVFQLPGGLRVASRSRSAWKRRVMAALPDERVQQIHRLRSGPGSIRDLPMHGVPRSRVVRLVEAGGRGEVAGVIEDEAAGPNWRSFRYFTRVVR